jgi:chitin disaccharide deacetylase
MATVPRNCRTEDEAHRRGKPRRLILHADDFGMNAAVNAGVVRGFTHGLLTSTSVLANAPGFTAALTRWHDLAARFARDDLRSLEVRRRLADSMTPFDLGVHLNLTQGRPLTGERYPRQMLDRNGLFPGVFGLAARLMKSGTRFCPEIKAELCAQIEAVVDSGNAPTHLNAHQYVDIFPAISTIIPDLLQRYAIPVTRVPWETHLTQTTLARRIEPANWCLAQIKRLFAFRHLVTMRRRRVPHPTAFFGTAHAGRIDLDLMRMFVAAAGPGVTEIGMHPGTFEPDEDGEARDDGWHDPLAPARAIELSLLTSAALVELLESRQVRLARLSDLSAEQAARAAA